MTDDQAIQIIKDINRPKAQLEMALLTLSHSGRAKSVKAIEEFLTKVKDPGLKFWAETAMEECLFFMD